MRRAAIVILVSDGPTLITSYDGTPTTYDVGVRDHLVDRFAPLGP